LAEPGQGLLRHHHQAGDPPGILDSVKELVWAIRTFVEGWNGQCHPFIWTNTADQILPHATREPDSDAGH
jgi:hypothetical protein